MNLIHCLLFFFSINRCTDLLGLRWCYGHRLRSKNGLRWSYELMSWYTCNAFALQDSTSTDCAGSCVYAGYAIGDIVTVTRSCSPVELTEECLDQSDIEDLLSGVDLSVSGINYMYHFYTSCQYGTKDIKFYLTQISSNLQRRIQFNWSKLARDLTCN